MPFEEMVPHFNELRQDIVLLYELKLALANCEYELQTLRHRFDTLAPGKVCLLNLTIYLITCVIIYSFFLKIERQLKLFVYDM